MYLYRHIGWKEINAWDSVDSGGVGCGVWGVGCGRTGVWAYWGVGVLGVWAYLGVGVLGVWAYLGVGIFWPQQMLCARKCIDGYKPYLPYSLDTYTDFPNLIPTVEI